MSGSTPQEVAVLSKSVTVAPLVLLSVVDHYNRTKMTGKKRVVGVLLGDSSGPNNTIRVANSFAIPFEEDEKTPSVWFLDHNYIESMSDMFKKINAKEKLIGWYHSGPKLRASDLEINDLFKKYTPNPLLLIVDVVPNEVGIPTDAYFAIEEIKNDGTATEKTFVHVPSAIEAEEAEEIGVEHLLRDIRDQAAGSLSMRLTNQLQSLQGLHSKLREIAIYLDDVLNRRLPVNHVILGKLQDVFNLLPSLSGVLMSNERSTEGKEEISDSGILGSTADELSRAFTIKTNDELMIVYLSSMIRAIIAFHDLIENKIENKKRENLSGITDTEKAETENADKDEPSESTAVTADNNPSKKA